jgi:DNA-binding IclR family transcriptional regulator
MSKSVDRVLDIFELFAEQGRPLSLTEMSRLLEISPSSCSDAINALQARGYIYELAPRRGYFPTPRLQKTANAIVNKDPVLLRADIRMRALRDALDESVNLSKVNGLQATYLLTLESSQPLRMVVQVGDNLRSLYATSAGKALLATLSDGALADYLKSAILTPYTVKTVSSKAALRAELAAGREKGWFLNQDESIEGVTTLSSIFTWNNSVYIVTIAGPSARLETKMEWAAGLLVDSCRRMEL